MIEIDNINFVSFDTKFHKNGTIINLNQIFSKTKIFLDNVNSIQGYFVCDSNVNLMCIKGMIMLILYDLNLNNNSTYNLEELFIGESNRLLINIPVNVAFAWQNISNNDSLVITDIDNVKNFISVYDENNQFDLIGTTIPNRFKTGDSYDRYSN
jgi:dTDP-4-dehydrorhamnose 3,5-epimerase-like enzyme